MIQAQSPFVSKENGEEEEGEEDEDDEENWGQVRSSWFNPIWLGRAHVRPPKTRHPFD